MPKQKSPRPEGFINAIFAFLFCGLREGTEACWVIHRGLYVLVVGQTTDTPEVYWFEAFLELRLPFHFFTCIETTSKKKKLNSAHAPFS